MVDIFENAQAELILGTSKGAVLFNPESREFIRYNTQLSPDNNFLNREEIWHISQGQDQTIWGGTRGYGLLRIDPKTENYSYSYDDESEGSIRYNTYRCILEDHSGILWVGTWGGGLNKSNLLSSKIVQYEAPADKPDKKFDYLVFGFEEDPSGYIWVSSSRNLKFLDSNTLELKDFQNNLQTINRPRFLLNENDSIMWIGTLRDGLSLLQF